MDLLADQGVDSSFVDEFVEHQEYITFLEDLESFVKSQLSKDTENSILCQCIKPALIPDTLALRCLSLSYHGKE